MAEDSKSTGLPKLADAVTKFDAAIKSVVADWPGETEDPAKQPPPVDQAEKTLTWARKKYDGLVRWVLGCFTAIGLIIFGSVPFVDLTAVDMGWVVFGLVTAGLGIAIIIYATTRALEPEDVSLGEIKQTLEWLNEHNPREAEHGFVFPRLVEASRLRKILASDPKAHFGPGLKNVDELLEDIGKREAAVLSLDADLGIPDPPDLRRKEPKDLDAILAKHVQAVAEAVGGTGVTIILKLERDPDVRKARTGISAAEGDQRTAAVRMWHEALVAAARPLAFSAPTDTEFRKRVQELLDATATAKSPTLYGATRKALETALSEEETAKSRLAREQTILTNRLEHRNMLLAESGVSQLRGTFRIVRRLMLFGAALTVLGGVSYAWAVANPEAGGLATPVNVTVNPETEAAPRSKFAASTLRRA